MIGKIITYGLSRKGAIARMEAALLETQISGIKTNIPLHQRILTDEGFVAGGPNIHYLEKMLAS
jgi:acetyl-CoA carboxylase biotin carboxylase subunit